MFACIFIRLSVSRWVWVSSLYCRADSRTIVGWTPYGDCGPRHDSRSASLNAAEVDPDGINYANSLITSIVTDLGGSLLQTVFGRGLR